MKVAIVHDSLVEFGGAERVLNAFLTLYPHADVYTAFASGSYRARFLPNVPPHKFHTSWLQYLPIADHTSFIQAVAPLVWRSFNLSSYDLVISHSLHLMSSFVSVPNGIHISCIMSPPKNIIGSVPPTPLQRATRYDAYIRPMYQRALHSIPHLIANSHHTQSVLRTHMGVSSAVIYPPVIIPNTVPKRTKGQYYLCVSRLAPDKNIELAVEAATALNVPLKIVGVSNTPLYESYLRALAGPTVEFLGYCPDSKLLALYRSAIAFLFPSYQEDFGIAPLEATAHGVPVVAYYGGGTKETVIDGVTGVFFRRHTKASLIRAIQKARTMRFSPSRLFKHAHAFRTQRFLTEFRSYVDAALNDSGRISTARSTTY